MSTLYWDCQTGISGDMIVASLLDLGADANAIRSALAPLHNEGFSIQIGRVNKVGLDCCDFNVVLDAEHDNHDHDMEYLYGEGWQDEHPHHHHAHELDAAEHHDDAHHHDAHSHDHAGHDHHHHRSYADVRNILAGLDLTAGARGIAERSFQILAQAEGKAHGVVPDQVHFHEVGAIDSIVDVVAAAVCLDNLGITDVVVPSITEGTGLVRCQHGRLPVPVPAVLNIATASGLPLHISERKGELVTPTGAAVAAAVITSTQLPERFCVKAVGLGAGKRAYEIPSILRAIIIEPQKPFSNTRGAKDPTCASLGTGAEGEASSPADTIWKLECNIDDSTGEMLGAVLQHLMDAGARDAHFLPVFMKKCRPAYELAVICDDEHREPVEKIIFNETTTIGIRRQRMERSIMDVSFREVKTPFGAVSVKMCERNGIHKAYPEYDSVVAAAKAANSDYRTVYLAAAQEAARL